MKPRLSVCVMLLLLLTIVTQARHKKAECAAMLVEKAELTKDLERATPRGHDLSPLQFFVLDI